MNTKQLQNIKLDDYEPNELLNLIPFDVEPSKTLTKLIQNYSPQHKKDRMLPEGCLGVGAAREVYPLPEQPEKYVIKIQRKNASARYHGQTKNEILSFVQCKEIRKWLPQIHNFDTEHFKWIIADRCEVNRNQTNEQLKEWFLENQKHALNSLKNFHKLKELKTPTEKLKYITLKKGISVLHTTLQNDNHLLNLTKEHNSNPQNYLENQEEFFEKLWSYLETRYHHSKSSTRVPTKEIERISGIMISAMHPMFVDFALEQISSKITFSDLHDGNIGFLKEKPAPFNARVIDMGMTKFPPKNERRLRSLKRRA